MSTAEDRLAAAGELWGGDAAVAAAWHDRQTRLAADEAQLAAGASPGHDE